MVTHVYHDSPGCESFTRRTRNDHLRSSQRDNPSESCSRLVMREFYAINLVVKKLFVPPSPCGIFSRTSGKSCRRHPEISVGGTRAQAVRTSEWKQFGIGCSNGDCDLGTWQDLHDSKFLRTIGLTTAIKRADDSLCADET